MARLKSIIKVLAALLVLAFTFPFIVGCGNEGGTTDSGTASEKSERALEIVKDGKSNYVIIRGEDADKAELDSAVKLRAAIKESTGVELEISNDGEMETDFEILVGRTNRSE